MIKQLILQFVTKQLASVDNFKKSFIGSILNPIEMIKKDPIKEGLKFLLKVWTKK